MCARARGGEGDREEGREKLGEVSFGSLSKRKQTIKQKRSMVVVSSQRGRTTEVNRTQPHLFRGPKTFI